MLGLPLYPIHKRVLDSAAGSVTLTLSDYRIPAWATHLGVRVLTRRDSGTTLTGLNLRLNGDTGSNYNAQRLTGASATAAASRDTAATSINGGLGAGASNVWATTEILIPQYTATDKHKTALFFHGAGENQVGTVVGRWANTAAVASLTIGLGGFAVDFASGTIIELFVVDELCRVYNKVLTNDGTFDVQGIESTPGDIVAIGVFRSDVAAVADTILHAINDDSTDADYAYQALRGNTSTPAALVSSASRIINVGSPTPGDNATAGVFGSLLVSYSQFAEGDNYPHYLCLSGMHESSGPTSTISALTGYRNDVEAVTRLAFEPNIGTSFKSGSGLWLYRSPKRLLSRHMVGAGGEASISFDVPQGYAAMQAMVYARSERAVAEDSLIVTLNGDTTDANYDVQDLRGSSTTVAAAQNASTRVWCVIPGASATANVFGGGVLNFPAYDKTDRHKHASVMHGTPGVRANIRSCRYESTDPIASIQYTLANGDDFSEGSVIELWGVLTPEQMHADRRRRQRLLLRGSGAVL